METKRLKRSYQLQTKLYHVEDRLLTFGPLGLTLRQCFVLMLGGSGSMHIWQLLDGFHLGGTIQFGLASVPLLLSALIAGVRLADRYSEAWLFVLLEYLHAEKVYLWRPDMLRRKRQRQDDALIKHQSQKKQQEDDDYNA